jgi:hypothetical protein
VLFCGFSFKASSVQFSLKHIAFALAHIRNAEQKVKFLEKEGFKEQEGFKGFSFKATYIFELWITDVWREFTFLAFRRVACVRYK